MSDPYNQYGQHNQQYNQPPQGQYASPAPGQGYPPPQGYQQAGYDQTQGYPQQQAPSGSSGYYGGGEQQYNHQYNQQYPGAAPANGQFPQQGPYPHDQYPQHSQAPNPYGQPGQQNYGPTDPNAQPEGDRGLMGALGGGAAGFLGGNKMGGHGIMGALAGAVLGSKLEDKKKTKKHGGGGYYH
ncbi:hypothetical protein BDV95DRAFT_351794 [Massariosphaeria phaeospora]|uniref:Glycine zipper 2TM domain-containing protein n=1 Tax=Massariosphaeria phaeospora TaxID=100035 RepID=A0A7C8I922_9PLEO|nr:hypothetical protein BDV95DRAFT_351794 [Massariosphaeria phaeospora]